MAPYVAIYGRPCRSLVCWTEVGERSSIGTNLVKEPSKKVNLDTKASSHGLEPIEKLRR